jgi:hypothetical protein
MWLIPCSAAVKVSPDGPAFRGTPNRRRLERRGHQRNGRQQEGGRIIRVGGVGDEGAIAFREPVRCMWVADQKFCVGERAGGDRPGVLGLTRPAGDGGDENLSAITDAARLDRRLQEDLVQPPAG